MSNMLQGISKILETSTACCPDIGPQADCYSCSWNVCERIIDVSQPPTGPITMKTAVVDWDEVWRVGRGRCNNHTPSLLHQLTHPIALLVRREVV